VEALINSTGSLPAAVTDDDELRCSKPKSCSSSLEEADVDCGMEFSMDEDGELKPADDVIMFPTVGNALGCSGFVCVNAGRPV